MHRAYIAAMSVLIGCAAPESLTRAQTTRVVVQSGGGPSTTPGWIQGAPIRTQVQVGADGETFVGVWLDAPSRAPEGPRRRPPMALSLVVDTSGSMSGEKIRNARLAAASLLESLADGDVVSIYAFSNGVVEIATPTPVNGATRPALMRRVTYLRAGGGTNLYGGVATGIQSLARAPSTHTVRRLVLISDGHANIGPADPASLATLAGNGTEWEVQITAIGVGLSYDEHTLGALAVQSSGRLYHLEHPAQMATILEREVNLLASTIATDAYIEVIPAPGVVLLEPLTQGAILEGNRLRLRLGSVFAGQHRDVVFRARIDTRRPGARPLATARLVYREADGPARPQTQIAMLRYQVTHDAPNPAHAMQPRVQAMVATLEAARAQRRAAEALDRGDVATAQRHFEFAARQVDGALAAPVAPAQRRRLEQTRRAVRRVRRRAASASSPAEARGAALDSYDAALEAEGY